MTPAQRKQANDMISLIQDQCKVVRQAIPNEDELRNKTLVLYDLTRELQALIVRAVPS